MLLIKQKFYVREPQGEDKPGRHIEYLPGMIVDRKDIPAGQTAEDWIAKELARDGDAPAQAEMPSHESEAEAA